MEKQLPEICDVRHATRDYPCWHRFRDFGSNTVPGAMEEILSKAFLLDVTADSVVHFETGNGMPFRNTVDHKL